MKEIMKPELRELIALYQLENGVDTKTAIRKVLADILHFCDKQDFNFAEQMQAARETYIRELTIQD